MFIVKKDQTTAIEVEPGLFGVKLIDGHEGTRDVALLRGWLNPGAAHSPHTHDTEEVVTFLSGSGTVRINDKDYPVQSGDSVWIPPKVVHSTVNTGAEVLSFVAAFSDNLVAARPVDQPKRHFALSRWINRGHWLFKRLTNRIKRQF